MMIGLDLIGMTFSLGILWGLVPNESVNPILKIILTLFFLADHCGLLPTIVMRIDEVDVNVEGDDNDDNEDN